MKRFRVAILASGSGTTAEAFIRTVQREAYPIDVTCAVSNNKTAGIFDRVAQLNAEFGLHIETAVINSSQPASKEPLVHGQQTEAEQSAILTLLEEHSVDLVLLLGYMKRIGPLLLQAYGWQPGYTSIYQARMLNTHPGLLPATIGTHGLGTQEFTLAQGMTEGGQTLHVVSDAYDTGPTVVEHRVPVEPGETAESFFARVQAVEKQHITADVMAFMQAQENYQKEA